MIGRTLSHYKVLEKIGEGGMGEVYLAKDTRLERTVAIKVLPPHLADNPNLKQRFEREARAVSSLNHPHICTLHDIGEQDGTEFLVMEYIEGETLADRLKKGALPFDQALRYATEIADALDKAHQQGVVHRDLKPGNIMLTKAGAKLLDFGLAKLREDVSAETSSVLSVLPTEDKPLTKEGSILGTFQYMAPEQLEGKEADARTDIFAFGAVLHEMVTGKRAFEGKSQASLVGAIMNTDPPPVSEFQSLSPPVLDRVASKCLAKEPDNRWQTARDLHDELKWTVEGGLADPAVAKTTGHSALANRALGIVFGSLIAALLFWIVLVSLPSLEPAVMRLAMSVQPAEELADWGSGRPSAQDRALTRTAMAFSPDGGELVFVGRRDDVQQLYARAMNQYEARPLPGTEGAVMPFFSPDGEWIGFWSEGQLRKIPAAGGSALNICTVPERLFGAVWMPDNTIIYALQGIKGLMEISTGLMEVSAAGGSPKVLTTVDSERGEVSHRLPALLPGGRAVLITVTYSVTGWGTSKIEVLSLDTGERKVLVDDGTDARYVSTGHLVYTRMGTLMAVPFDIESLEVKGKPVVMIDGIAQAWDNTFIFNNTGMAQLVISPSGTLAYVKGGIFPEAERSLVWVDRDGAVEPINAPPRSYWSPSLAPDDSRIAVYSYSNNLPQVWIYDLGRSTLSLLTPEGQSQTPKWTPDGTHVVYAWSTSGMINNLARIKADGSGSPEPLMEGENRVFAGSLSADGQTLAYFASHLDTGWDLWLLSVEGERQVHAFLRTPSNEHLPSFSPDGKWLAYVSNTSGQDEVIVQPFPGPGPRIQISTDGGSEPVWAKGGKELFYRRLNPQQVMSVTIETGSELLASKPTVLFDDVFLRATPGCFDVASDGRFLMVLPEPVDWETTDEIQIVLNWTEELEERVASEW